jgi:hypothetical protein
MRKLITIIIGLVLVCSVYGQTKVNKRITLASLVGKPNTTAVRLLADTIPIFVFGGGGGNAGDTTAFTTSTIYGSFFNEGSDTLAVTSLRVIMLGDATDTLSVDILWDVNLNDGSPTELNSDPLPVNSFNTGDEDTSFAAYKIPPDSWVWCETPGVVAGRKPTYLNAQISGYKIPKY